MSSSTKKLSYDKENYLNGITRKKKRGEFIYYYIKNNKPVGKRVLDRIKKLGIPPAWRDVWVSSDASSSIQVTGYDSKDRKQYRYNESHIQEAEQEKFIRMYDFIKAIPRLEKILIKHKRLPHYSLNRVIVSMLTLVKELHMRVGKECYAKTNKSYGVSSLKKTHVKIKGDKIHFKFKGKSNKILSYEFEDNILKKHIKSLLKLKGEKLFQFIDDDKKIKRVTDTDLILYIQEYMGDEFTCKDFRTYAANYYFVKSIIIETKKRKPVNRKTINKNILNAIENTAHYLRHTQAISKKSYITDYFVDLYKTNPKYFSSRKNKDTDTILLSLLRKYKKEVMTKH